MESNRELKKRYTIMVGMNDKDDNVQKFQTERILELVTNCCKGYGLAFSCYVQRGGYKPFNGGYILEKSVAVVLLDPPADLVDELSKDLCAFLNQETVMVTVDQVECYYISHAIQDA